MKDDRLAQLGEYRKFSLEADELANSGDKEKAVAMLTEWQNTAKQYGDKDYELFFQAEVIAYSKPEFKLQIKLMQEAFAWAVGQGLGADFFLLRTMGVYHSQKGDEDSAIEYYDKALEENPHYSDAMRNMGVSLGEKGDPEAAIIWCDKALQENPHDSDAMRGKSVVEFNRGDVKKAFKLLCEAIRLKLGGYRNDFFFVCGSIGKDAEKEWAKLFAGKKPSKFTAKEDTQARISELRGFIYNFRKIYKKEADKFLADQIKEEEKRVDFLTPESLIVKKESLLLTLRRWNSFTPAIPTGDNERSIGGGYFMRHAGKGIVIDPGYHFIENFHQAGGRIFDIDAVVLTHAHNDHTIEFETLLTLVHEYNKNLEELKKKGEFEDSKPKRIDIYMNNGSFMKFSGLLNLRNNSSVRHVFTLNPNNNYEIVDDKKINLQVVPAYHDELVAKDQSVGLIFDLNGEDFNRRIVFTGDTGLLPLDPNEETPKALKDDDREVWKGYQADKKRPDVLVVHIGSIKPEELEEKFFEPEKAVYPNHLGILGTTRVISKCKPKFAIVSEFGEEMKAFRCDLIRGLEKVVIKPSVKENDKKGDYSDMRVVPGDLALIYDLKAEKFYSCVTDKWCGYKNIDYASDSEDPTKISGIYFFAKTSRKTFTQSPAKRKHYAKQFVENLRERLKVYFK